MQSSSGAEESEMPFTFFLLGSDLRLNYRLFWEKTWILKVQTKLEQNFFCLVEVSQLSFKETKAAQKSAEKWLS